MRNMRSSSPIFLLIGIALMAVVGMFIMDASMRSAVNETQIANSSSVNNDTVKADLTLGIHDLEYAIIFGICGVMFIVAIYFALRNHL